MVRVSDTVDQAAEGVSRALLDHFISDLLQAADV
jgi:hypothetical protein